MGVENFGDQKQTYNKSIDTHESLAEKAQETGRKDLEEQQKALEALEALEKWRSDEALKALENWRNTVNNLSNQIQMQRRRVFSTNRTWAQKEVSTTTNDLNRDEPFIKSEDNANFINNKTYIGTDYMDKSDEYILLNVSYRLMRYNPTAREALQQLVTICNDNKVADTPNITLDITSPTSVFNVILTRLDQLGYLEAAGLNKHNITGQEFIALITAFQATNESNATYIDGRIGHRTLSTLAKTPLEVGVRKPDNEEKTNTETQWWEQNTNTTQTNNQEKDTKKPKQNENSEASESTETIETTKYTVQTLSGEYSSYSISQTGETWEVKDSGGNTIDNLTTPKETTNSTPYFKIPKKNILLIKMPESNEFIEVEPLEQHSLKIKTNGWNPKKYSIITEEQKKIREKHKKVYKKAQEIDDKKFTLPTSSINIEVQDQEELKALQEAFNQVKVNEIDINDSKLQTLTIEDVSEEKKDHLATVLQHLPQIGEQEKDFLSTSAKEKGQLNGFTYKVKNSQGYMAMLSFDTEIPDLERTKRESIPNKLYEIRSTSWTIKKDGNPVPILEVFPGLRFIKDNHEGIIKTYPVLIKKGTRVIQKKIRIGGQTKPKKNLSTIRYGGNPDNKIGIPKLTPQLLYIDGKLTTVLKEDHKKKEEIMNELLK